MRRGKELAVPAVPGAEQSEPLRLDPDNLRLWCGDDVLALTPKAFAVLRYLVEHPRRLVSKQELLEALWPNTYVGDSVLKVTVLEIRKALGDRPCAPRFIETVHRNGYRFLGGIVSGPVPDPVAPFAREATVAPACDAEPPVGRAAVLDVLDALLASAAAGERQVAFISGEVGIGKSAVVDAFLERVQGAGAAWLARGQCLQQHEAGEDYLPVLEALGRLGREPGREGLVELLRRQAPTWLAQLPALAASGEREAMSGPVPGLAQQSMLREMTETLDSLTASVPLVLVLEDMQWSDPATLDLLAALARRRHAARLLVIATYRPVDESGASAVHALAQELALHRRCEQLPLFPLGVDEVAQCLARRLRVDAVPAALATLVQERSDGNPLFVAGLVEHLLASGAVEQREGGVVVHANDAAIAAAVPERLRSLVEKTFERLPAEDQRLLEAASVAGVAFVALELASALDEDPTALEERCEQLARRTHLLASAGVAELPDGGVAGRYRFRHGLYRSVIEERLSPARRALLRLRTGFAAASAMPVERLAPRAARFGHGREGARPSPTPRRAIGRGVRRSAM